MEAVDASLTVTAQDKIKACDFILEPVPWPTESRFVGNELPLPGEDGTSLEFVHLL